MTQTLRAILVASTLAPLGASAAGPLQPPDAVGKIGLTLKPDRSVIYKEIGERKLRLDIFNPKDFKPGDRRPCVVAIHGGGWKNGNPAWMYPFLTDLVDLGMIGISVEYRLLTKSTTVFDCVKDARSAIRYLRAHAAELGIDPDRIAICGSSAGGLLAVDLLLANNPDIDNAGDDLGVSCAPNVLVLHYPVIDTSKAGYGNAKIGEKWQVLSPLEHVKSGMPPTLLLHGTGDELVPFKGVQAFHDAVKKAGNRCELITFEGGRHGYLRKDLVAYEKARADTRKFLASLDYIKSTEAKTVLNDPLPSNKPSIPTIDISGDTARRVVIAEGTPEIYQGHPTTVLLPDGRTMYCVWTIGHGGTCGPMKRSDDGGRTWSDLLETPENWKTIRNCPAIYRLIDPKGAARLFVFAASGPDRTMHSSYSEDDGRTWSPMKSTGLKCVMPFCTIVPIDGGKRLLAQTNIQRPNDPAKDNVIGQSISEDGGFTWSSFRIVLDMPNASPCEPEIIRSPDGNQLLALLRENSRKSCSKFMMSNDEGQTWGAANDLPPGLTGDRHMAHYAKDGRLVICFRDTGRDSPSRDHFVAWVGTYEDIRSGNEGQYRIKLLHSYAPKPGDCGYPGLEMLPDGTFVATTYVKYKEGPDQQSVVSTRFKLDETDALVAKISRSKKPAEKRTSTP